MLLDLVFLLQPQQAKQHLSFSKKKIKVPESRGRQNRHIRSEKKIIMLKEKKENNKKPEIYSLSTGGPCICDFRIHDPPYFLI